MDKVTAVVLVNPFDMNSRVIKELDFQHIKTLSGYISSMSHFLQDHLCEIVVSVNGRIIENSEWDSLTLAPGSFIAICPIVGKGDDGKGILSIVAGIALSVVSMGVGNVAQYGAWSGAATSAGMAGWGLGATLAASAVLYLGGQLINSLSPASSVETSTSTTYSWSKQPAISQQGNPVGITYGTVRPTPQVLASHITNDGDKQYLNLLLCGGDGPIDSITNLRIDDNPIANYEDVQVDYRLGTNTQTAIPNFGDIYSDQTLNYELTTNGWVVQQLAGDGNQGMEVTIELPSGLYYLDNSGNTQSAWVDVLAQYREVGAASWIDWITGGAASTEKYVSQTNLISASITNAASVTTGTFEVIILGGTTPLYFIRIRGSDEFLVYQATWQEYIVFQGVTLRLPYPNSNENTEMYYYTISTRTIANTGISGRITASTTSSYRVSYRLDNIASNKYYEVRMKCSAKSGDTTRYATRPYWTMLSGIIYDDFCHPGKVLVGIKALATNQLSGGMPTVTWEQTRNSVKVWNGSAYVQKPATNPAWAAYDLIHRCKSLVDPRDNLVYNTVFGAPAKLLIYQDFLNWATNCSNASLTCNFFLDAANDLWTSLQPIEAVGRGKVVLKGTRFSAIYDGAKSPVQLFGMGNIIQGSFSEEFLSIKDRANAVEITFNDKDQNYERTTISVYSNDYDISSTIKNPTQITMNAIDNWAQAYREAKYKLRQNQYLLRTVSFSADVDAIACQVGDCILVQHDVPQWGFGGRIAGATSTSSFTLDQEVTLEAGITYEIMLRLNATDTLEKRTITPVSQTTTTNIISVTSPFSAIPSEDNDVYTIGEVSVSSKPFIVAKIDRSMDQIRKISALEYVEGVYTEATTIPEIEYSALEPLCNVTSVSLGQEAYRQKDGTLICNAYASWVLSRTSLTQTAYLYTSYDGETWTYYGSYRDTSSAKIENVRSLTTLYVKVFCRNELGIAGGVKITSLYITGRDVPPPNVNSLSANVLETDRRKITLTWDAVTAPDLAGYRIRLYESVVASLIAGQSFVYTATKNITHNFTIVAVDNSGNESATPASISITPYLNPSNVSNFAAIAESTDRSILNLSWANISDTDLSQFEIRVGTVWNTGAVVQQTKANHFSYRVPNSGYYKFWIAAINTAGNYSLSPVSAGAQVTCEPSAPTGLTATQGDRNKAQITLTWNAPSGLDIAGYEVTRNNVSIGYTANANYTDTVSASGTYVYKVRAKSVGGFYGAYASVTKTVTIEPMDVTGFTGSQFLDNRSKVRLTWNANSAGDMSHYVIKEGASWDAGTVVADHAVGTYCDLIITTERVYTWWIKAVSIGGKQSQFPASFSSIFSANPSAPTNFKVVTNPRDRSKAIASWNSVSDADFFEYELRYGGVSWETATIIASSTKETSYEWEPPSSNSYTLRLKARNTAKFESDEVLAVYNSKVEPSNVGTFTASQNGDNVLLVWTKITDADVVGYEIREGSTFENGTVIATGVNDTQYQIPVSMETTKQFWIKAINRAGNYSQGATSASVTISNLTPRNVISTTNEITLQNGTASNTVFGTSSFTFATLGGRFSNYPSTRFSDIGGASVLKLAENTKTYSRTSTAYLDGTLVATGVPRVDTDGMMIEEPTTNLLTANQSNVETDTTGFSEYKSYGGIVTLTRDTTQYYSGTASLKFACDGAYASQGFSVTTPALDTASTYTYSLWIKSFTSAELLWRITGSADTFANLSLIGDGEWHRYVYTFSTTSAGSAILIIRTVNAQAVTLYADCLQLEKLPYATSWNVGGEFRETEYLHVNGSVINTTTTNLISPDAILTGDGSPTVVSTTDYVYSGEFAKKIITSIAGNFYINSSTKITQTASTSFTVSCKIRRADGAAISGIVGYLYASNNTNAVPVITVGYLGDGWYQLTATRALTAAGATYLCGFCGFGSGTTLYVDDFQLEAKPYSTSFAGMGATRIGEGTIELDFIAPSTAKMNAANTNGYYPFLVQANTGTNNGSNLWLTIYGGYLRGWIGKDGASAYEVLVGTTALIPGTKYRAAIRWDGTSASIWLNGVKEKTSVNAPIIAQGAWCAIAPTTLVAQVTASAVKFPTSAFLTLQEVMKKWQTQAHWL